MSEWYYSSDNQRKGPVSIDDLKGLVVEGKVLPTDLVWQQGMADWVKLASIAELASPLPAVSDPEILGGIDADNARPPAAAPPEPGDVDHKQERQPGKLRSADNTNGRPGRPRGQGSGDREMTAAQRSRQSSGRMIIVVIGGAAFLVGSIVVAIMLASSGGNEKAGDGQKRPPDAASQPEKLQFEVDEVDLLPGHQKTIAVLSGRAAKVAVEPGLKVDARIDDDGAIEIMASASAGPHEQTIKVVSDRGNEATLKLSVRNSYMRKFNLKMGDFASWYIPFTQGRKVEIWLKSMSTSDMNLYVFDAQGQQIIADDSDSKDCYVTFVPEKTQLFKVEIRNERHTDERRKRNGNNNGTVRMVESPVDRANTN